MPTGRAAAPLSHNDFRPRQKSVELDGLSYQPLRVAWTDLGDGAPAIARDSRCAPRAGRERVALDPSRHAGDLHRGSRQLSRAGGNSSQGSLIISVELLRRLNNFPGAGEAGRGHESVARPEGALRAIIAGDYDDARQKMAELALREHNAPLSGLGFPYARIEPSALLNRLMAAWAGSPERMRSACGR